MSLLLLLLKWQYGEWGVYEVWPILSMSCLPSTAACVYLCVCVEGE